MPDRIGIIGSRLFPRIGMVVSVVQLLPRDCMVVSGTVPKQKRYDGTPATLEDQGSHVDRVAIYVAKQRGLRTKVHRAEWDILGRRAGPARNRPLVSDSDVVLAFWDGTSPGTAGAIKIAHELGKPLAVVSPDPASWRPDCWQFHLHRFGVAAAETMMGCLLSYLSAPADLVQLLPEEP